jgi:hypothetical protein
MDFSLHANSKIYIAGLSLSKKNKMYKCTSIKINSIFSTFLVSL